MTMMSSSDLEQDLPPLHDRLWCDVEDFDDEMHIYMCEVLYDNVDI